MFKKYKSGFSPVWHDLSGKFWCLVLSGQETQMPSTVEPYAIKLLLNLYEEKDTHLLPAGNTPINCSRGLKGSVFFSNSVGMSPMLTKSLANGA